MALSTNGFYTDRFHYTCYISEKKLVFIEILLMRGLGLP